MTDGSRTPNDHGVRWRFWHHHGEPGELTHRHIDPRLPCEAPREDDSSLRNIGSKIGRNTFESFQSGVSDLAHEVMDGRTQIMRVDRQGAGPTRREMPSAHPGLTQRFRERRPNLTACLLGGLPTHLQPMVVAKLVDYGEINLLPANKQGA